LIVVPFAIAQVTLVTAEPQQSVLQSGVRAGALTLGSSEQDAQNLEQLSTIFLRSTQVSYAAMVFPPTSGSTAIAAGTGLTPEQYTPNPLLESIGRGYGLAAEMPRTGPRAVSPLQGLYGPFWRSEGPSTVTLIERSGVILGHPPTNFYNSNIPTVQAYPYALPEGATGVQFYTAVKPKLYPLWAESKHGGEVHRTRMFTSFPSS
jgi:hypothetical protein